MYLAKTFIEINISFSGDSWPRKHNKADFDFDYPLVPLMVTYPPTIAHVLSFSQSD